MYTAVRSENGATVPRSVRTRAREESVSGSVIQGALFLVSRNVWQLLESQHTSMTCAFRD